MYRDHNCGELNISNVGEIVTIAGWIQRIRNLGSMKFIDLRDQFGITQIVIGDNEEMQAKSNELVTECVISVKGKVVERSNKNKNMKTGEITKTGLPTSNVLYYELEDNNWCCIRPSGTEPKIKLYMGVKGESNQDAEEKLEYLKNAMLEVINGK